VLPLPVYILHAAAISKHFGTSILFGMKGQSVPCCLNLINYNWKVHAIVSMQDNMHAGLYTPIPTTTLSEVAMNIIQFEA
jgi:hypothetical protein